MRQNMSGQSGSRYQGRPGMGVRSETLGIAADYTRSQGGVGQVRSHLPSRRDGR
jgi:hypothetical protein